MKILQFTHYFNNDFYDPSAKGFCSLSSINDYLNLVMSQIPHIKDSVKMSHNDQGSLVVDFLQPDYLGCEHDPVASCLIVREVDVYETPIPNIINPENAEVANVIRNALRKDR